MTALLHPDETLTLGVNVIVRPGADRPTEPVGGTCDWGDCQFWAITRRWSDGHGWLPVCERHADRYGVAAPQEWVALTGPCPRCELPMPGAPGRGWVLAPGFKQFKPCPDCRDGRRIVPLYRAVDPALDPVDVCQEQLRLLNRFDAEALVRDGWNPSPVLVGRGSIEVVPVVEGWGHPPSLDESPKCLVFAPPYAILELVKDYTPLILAFGDQRLKLSTLDPLPQPGRDFGVVIDCVELAS